MIEEKIKQPEIRTELLRQLSRAVRFRDISGGVRLVEKARSVMTDRNDPATGQFRSLEAQLIYFSGDYQKALACARVASSLLAPFGETEDLARTFLVTGMALSGLGNYREAETAFLDAESLFRRCDGADGRVEACNQLARVYFIRAEFKSALKYLLEAIKLADALDNQRRLAYLWGNLGRVYTLLGNFKKASESLRMNVEISDSLEDNKEKAKAILSLGYVEMQCEQYEKADRHFDEARVFLAALGMDWDMTIYKTYLGELKTRCGEYTAARHLLNEAIDSARTISPESSLMVAPLRHLAALELACGKLTAASQLGNKALALADRIGEQLEKAAALRVLGQIAMASDNADRNNRKKAAGLFFKAIEIFEEVDARFERAETLVAMAASKLGSPRHIMANLFRAADIYKRLGTTSKYESTQELINQIESSTGETRSGRPEPSGDKPVMVTANKQMQKIIRDIGFAAQSELPILLFGETGTGKDLLARYYHSMTGRTGQFVAVNCAAFPDTLLESELFGYRKGAFTGAASDKEGLLHRANGGTFFLDEVGEMSLSSQAKLLMVIETCRTRRLGAISEEKLDIRIIAATNCDLAAMVAEGTFRRDLFYRLSGITFVIPPLADRPEDIPLLLNHFLIREGVMGDEDKVDPALITEFSSRSWPGNVRQLESEVKKLVLFSTMAREDSLGELAGVLVQNDDDSQTASLFNQVEQFEKALILKALRRANWNKSQAARSLAIHESTLRAKMKRYDLDQMMVS